METRKCDICLEEGDVISDSPFLSLLLHRHLGILLLENLFACGNCTKLVNLWDEFSQQAKINLFVSHPKMQYLDFLQPSKIDELNDSHDQTMKDANELRCTVSCADSISAAAVWSELEANDEDNRSTIQLEDLADEARVDTFENSNVFSTPQMNSMDFQLANDCSSENPNQELVEDVTYVENLEQGQQTEQKCTHCSKKFLDEESLVHHIQIVHSAETQTNCATPTMGTKLSCPVCHGCLSTEFQMKQHIRLCHPSFQVSNSNLVQQSEFVCKLCNIDCVSKQQLENHKQLKHRETLIKKTATVIKLNQKKCYTCNRIFSNRRSLMSHNRIYHNSVLIESSKNCKFNCKFCGRGFDRKAALFSHLRHHPEMKNQKTLIVDDKTKEINNVDKDNSVKLVNNQNYRKENSIYFCNFCSSTYRFEISMQEHIKELHSPEISSNVNIPPTKPTTESNQHNESVMDLNQGINILANELQLKLAGSSPLKEFTRVGKQFKCNICSKVFHSGNGIDYHLHKHALGEGIKIDPKYFTKVDSNYKCNICDKLLSTSPGIQYHIRHVHLKLDV